MLVPSASWFDSELLQRCGKDRGRGVEKCREEIRSGLGQVGRRRGGGIFSAFRERVIGVNKRRRQIPLEPESVPPPAETSARTSTDAYRTTHDLYLQNIFSRASQKGKQSVLEVAFREAPSAARRATRALNCISNPTSSSSGPRQRDQPLDSCSGELPSRASPLQSANLHQLSPPSSPCPRQDAPQLLTQARSRPVETWAHREMLVASCPAVGA